MENAKLEIPGLPHFASCPRHCPGIVGAVAKVCCSRELQIKTGSLSLPDTDASRALGAGEDGKPSAD